MRQTKFFPQIVILETLPQRFLLNIGLFLTITGLFFSRIALSVGMALLVGNALATHFWFKNPIKQWVDKSLIIFDFISIIPDYRTVFRR